MSFKQKPFIGTCDPGIVACSCARMGLPGPGVGLALAMPMWEGSGKKIYDYSGNRHTGNWKETAPPVVVVAADEGGAWWPTEPTWERKEKLRERILRDDNDILEIVMSIVLSGRL